MQQALQLHVAASDRVQPLRVGAGRRHDFVDRSAERSELGDGTAVTIEVLVVATGCEPGQIEPQVEAGLALTQQPFQQLDRNDATMGADRVDLVRPRVDEALRHHVHLVDRIVQQRARIDGEAGHGDLSSGERVPIDVEERVVTVVPVFEHHADLVVDHPVQPKAYEGHGSFLHAHHPRVDRQAVREDLGLAFRGIGDGLADDEGDVDVVKRRVGLVEARGYQGGETVTQRREDRSATKEVRFGAVGRPRKILQDVGRHVVDQVVVVVRGHRRRQCRQQLGAGTPRQDRGDTPSQQVDFFGVQLERGRGGGGDGSHGDGGTENDGVVREYG